MYVSFPTVARVRLLFVRLCFTRLVPQTDWEKCLTATQYPTMIPKRINIVDTPGYFDFVGEMIEGVRVSGSAVIVVSGKSGVSAGTEKAWKMAKIKDIPVIFFVNKLDDPKADYVKTVNQLKDTFGKSVAPFAFPIMDGDEFRGFINIVKMKAKMFAADGTALLPPRG